MSKIDDAISLLNDKISDIRNDEIKRLYRALDRKDGTIKRLQALVGETCIHCGELVTKHDPSCAFNAEITRLTALAEKYEMLWDENRARAEKAESELTEMKRDQPESHEEAKLRKGTAWQNQIIDRQQDKIEKLTGKVNSARASRNSWKHEADARRRMVKRLTAERDEARDVADIEKRRGDNCFARAKKAEARAEADGYGRDVAVEKHLRREIERLRKIVEETVHPADASREIARLRAEVERLCVDNVRLRDVGQFEIVRNATERAEAAEKECEIRAKHDREDSNHIIKLAGEIDVLTTKLAAADVCGKQDAETIRLASEVERLTAERDAKERALKQSAHLAGQFREESDKYRRERDRAVFGMNYIREIHGLQDWKDLHDSRIDAALARDGGGA